MHVRNMNQRLNEERMAAAREYREFLGGRDKPSQNVILILAVILACITYKAVFNPPGGIWREDGPNTLAPSSAAMGTTADMKQPAGISILATQNRLLYDFFIIGNTLAFLFCMGIIDDLIQRFTVLRMGLLTLICTYILCVFMITPSEFCWWSVFICLMAGVTVAAVRVWR